MSEPHRSPAVAVVGAAGVEGIIDCEGLDLRQKTVVALVASGRSYRDAAKTAGVAYGTVRRWSQLPAFRNALQELLEAGWERAWDQIKGAYVGALDACSAALADEDPKVRLRAAELIMRTTSAALQLQEARRARETPEADLEVLKAELLAEARAQLDDGGADHRETTVKPER